MRCPLKAIEQEIMKQHKTFIETKPQNKEIIEEFYFAIICGLEPIYIECSDNCFRKEGEQEE